jgi:hypothetical protein
MLDDNFKTATLERICDKFMGNRSLLPHPHPALPLKGRENSERFRPKELKSIGFLPLQGGGRRGMG